jgi:hypothetical protein
VTLKTQARRLEPRREGIRRERREILLALGRALREIGEKQGRRSRRQLSARNRHRAVGGKKLQRLVGMARHQVVEVAAQCGKSALGSFDRGGGIRRAAIGQCGEHLLYCAGEFGNAFQPDDGQRAVGLVHGGGRLLQLVARRVGGVGGKALSGPLECKVDFPLDPGQRPDIEIRAHEKCFVTPWLVGFLFTL